MTVLTLFQPHAGQRWSLYAVRDITGCQLMPVQEGRIADVRGHYPDQYALDAFWKAE
jgi:hypothetical protein